MGKTEKNRCDSKNQSQNPIETQPKSDKYKTEKKSTGFIATGNNFQYGLFECDKNENGWRALLASTLCPCCTAGYIAEYIGIAVSIIYYISSWTFQLIQDSLDWDKTWFWIKANPL